MNGHKRILIIFASILIMMQSSLLLAEGEDDRTRMLPSKEVDPDYILASGVEIPSTSDLMTNKSFFYPVPDGATVLSANMDISVQPLTDEGKEFPVNTWINIAEGQREYQFKNEVEDTFQGNWGYNYQTISGTTFSSFTGDTTMTISLPINASVKAARLNITGFQRDQELIETNISSSASGDRFGSMIRSFGDVNNDNDDEILVSSPGESLNSGAVYYVLSSSIDDDFRRVRFASSSNVGARFGSSISGLFKYSDTGNNAVAIGAPLDGINNLGSVTTFGFRAKSPGISDVVITGNNTNGEFGSSVEAADFDDDGDQELFIGAPGDNGGEGAVYIYSISSNQAELISVINGTTGESNFGRSLATGDMNEDGIDDVMISSDEYVRLFLGSGTVEVNPDETYDPISDSGISASEIESIKFLGRTGQSATTFAACIPTATTGRVVLYNSGTTLDPSVFDLLTPPSSIPNFGFSVGAGDMDQDSAGEIAVGAPGTSNSIGGVFVYKRGQNNPWKTMPVYGENGDRFGHSVAIADAILMGDDNFKDVIVGVPQFTGSIATGPGRIHRFDYYDLSTLTDNSPIVKVEDNTAWTYQQPRLSGDVTTGDISGRINSFLSNAAVNYRSEYEDFTWVNITVETVASNNFEDSASFNVTSFEIIYDETIPLDDLTREFNRYMNDDTRERDTMDGKNYVLVPLAFSSQSPGKIRIESIDVDYDEVPFIANEPDEIHIPEDTIDTRLLDLYRIISDDHTGNPYLNYSVTTTGLNSSIADVYISEHRYLAVDLTNTTDSNGDGRGDYLNWSGQIEFFLTVRDEVGGQFISDRYIIHVDEVNDPPAVSKLPNIAVTQDDTFSYTPAGVDDELDDINYTLDYSNTPENMTIDHNLGTVKWTPNMWEVGPTNYTLVLRDQEDERSYTFPLQVIDEPDDPVFLTPPPTAPDGVLIETRFEYQIIAVDPDIGDRVTYSMVNPPQGADINPETGLFTWTPPEHYNQPVEFTIRALDRTGGITEMIFTLNTTFTDTIPTLTEDPEQTLYDSVPWNYTVEIIDPEDHAIRLNIAEKPEGMEYDSISQKLSWTPDVDQVGEFNLSLRVRSTRFDFYLNYTLEVLRSDRDWTLTLTGLEEGETVKGKVEMGGDLIVSPSSIRDVQIKVGDNNWTYGNHAEGRWSYTLDTTEYDDGTYTILVRGFDGAEYSDTESVSITIKNEKEKTSPLVFIVFAVIIVVLILVGVLIFFLLKKRNEKKEQEELEKRQKEAIEQSKKSMDEFLQETGADLDQSVDYTKMEVHDESVSGEELSHIDDIFQPLNIPKQSDDTGQVDIPEDPLASAEAATGPVMGESMTVDNVDEPTAGVPPSPQAPEPPKSDEDATDENISR